MICIRANREEPTPHRTIGGEERSSRNVVYVDADIGQGGMRVRRMAHDGSVEEGKGKAIDGADSSVFMEDGRNDGGSCSVEAVWAGWTWVDWVVWLT